MSDPVVKTTIIHAAMNDLAIVGAIYNWYTRRHVEGFLSSGANVLISSILFGAVAYSGYLGGGLVYEHGVGVQRMGDGKKEKDRKVAEVKTGARKDL